MGASIHRSWALWSKWAKFLPRGNRYILPGALCDKYALLLQVASILTVAIAHLTLTCEECAIQPLENCVEHKLKREVDEKEAFDEERSTFMIKLIPSHKTSQWQYIRVIWYNMVVFIIYDIVIMKSASVIAMYSNLEFPKTWFEGLALPSLATWEGVWLANQKVIDRWRQNKKE